MKQAIFIEPAGILTPANTPPDHAELVRPAPFAPDHAIAELCKRLKAAGFKLFATTNQPGLSQGCLSRRELDRTLEAMQAAFGLDRVLVCPHDESDDCPCRKPKPGLLQEAAFGNGIDLDSSYVISERWQDAEAARWAGCTSILLQSRWNGSVHRDFLVPNFAAAVEKVIERKYACQFAYA